MGSLTASPAEISPNSVQWPSHFYSEARLLADKQLLLRGHPIEVLKMCKKCHWTLLLESTTVHCLRHHRHITLSASWCHQAATLVGKWCMTCIISVLWELLAANLSQTFSNPKIKSIQICCRTNIYNPHNVSTRCDHPSASSKPLTVWPSQAWKREVKVPNLNIWYPAKPPHPTAHKMFFPAVVYPAFIHQAFRQQRAQELHHPKQRGRQCLWQPRWVPSAAPNIPHPLSSPSAFGPLTTARTWGLWLVSTPSQGVRDHETQPLATIPYKCYPIKSVYSAK